MREALADGNGERLFGPLPSSMWAEACPSVNSRVAIPTVRSNLPPAIATWRDQLERISERASPCRYLTPTQWATFRECAIDFCDRLGADALALGWTDRQLFGVHPAHGTLRGDYCGALMIAGKRAQAVKADRIVFERTAGYRNTPGKAWGPPIWEFKAKVG